MDDDWALARTLPRDARAIAFAGGGWPIIAAVMIVAVALSDPLLAPGVAAWIAFWCAVLVGTSMNRVVLHERTLESGGPFRRRRWRAESISHAIESPVTVIRGARTAGVAIVLHDGNVVPLTSSAFLRASTRNVWIERLQQWLEAS